MDNNTNSKQFPKIIFTGGGSGGHLSIIKGMVDYLREEGFNVDEKILIVGGKLGMISDPGKSLDERRIPEFGVPYTFIRGGKLHRAFRWATVKLLFGFIPGIYDSFKVIRNFNPEIVFATGGYVTLPMIIVSRLFGKRIIIHEQTLHAGLTNRIGALFADKVLLTFEESLKFFPNKKSKVVGNVIRKEVFISSEVNVQTEIIQVVQKARIENRPLIYITGGSLGAHKINLFIKNNLKFLLERYSLIWQTGENELYNDYDSILKEHDELIKSGKIYLTKYVRAEIGYILANADVVICRPGANTLYELSVLNKKAIMIPLWVTSKSDQEANAKWYMKNNLSITLDEKSLEIDDFISQVEKLLKTKSSSSFSYKAEAVCKEILNEILAK